MPTYEYKCKKCGTTFCVNMSIESSIGIAIGCPVCCSKDVAKKFFPVPAIYKSKGFTKKIEGEPE